MLLTVHSMVPHSHADHETVNMEQSDTSPLADWLQDFFHHDLGDNHLEHYMPSTEDSAQLAMEPEMCFWLAFISTHLQPSVQDTELESLAPDDVLASDQPPLRLDAPLRAPPSRA